MGYPRHPVSISQSQRELYETLAANPTSVSRANGVVRSYYAQRATGDMSRRPSP